MMNTTRRRVVPAVAAVLATISSIAAAANPSGPAIAAGHALEVDSTTVELVDGIVVVARDDNVSVTFTNVSGAEVRPDELSLPFELPNLPSGDPLVDTLLSIGIDPAAVVHETTSIQTNIDTCTTSAVAAGDSCTIEIQVLPQGLGTVRPFGAGIRLVDSTTSDVLADTFVIWGAGPPNDQFANAEDISALSIPPYQVPLLTASVSGDTSGATIESGEYATDPNDASAPTATVWYRYTSPPGGFAGQLGYTVTPGFRVVPVVAGQPDPLNPFLIPADPPAVVDQLVWAPGNGIVPAVPPFENGYVRMEPGHTVWFQVSALPWTADGPFTLELVQAPNPQDDIVDAYDPFQGVPLVNNSGWGGDGTTYHTTPDVPSGLATTWATHVVDRSGRLSVDVGAQTPLTRPSTEPVGVAIYRAPSTAIVTDATELGAPIASTPGALGQGLQVESGQYVTVPAWIAELRDVPVQPGRYYIGVTRPTAAGTFYGIGTRFVADTAPPPPTDTTPPTVSVSVPADGAQLLAADVGTLSYTCTDTGTIVDETILVDGQPGTAALPSTFGDHTFEVRCTDDAGNTGSASVTYTVVIPDLDAATYEDTPGNIDLLTGVAARPGRTLAVVSVGAPQHGAVSNPGPTVTYTPAANYFGTDQFSYTVSDGTTTQTATVIVRVAAVNDLPVVRDDALAVTAGQTVTVDLLANASDVDGDALRIVSVSRVVGSSSLGTLTCPAVGACTYAVPATAAGGVETWTYRVIDSAGYADGRLTVTVTPLPPAPAGDHLTISLGGAITLTAGGPVTSGDITVIPPGTAGGGRIVGAGTVGTTTVAFNLVRPQNSPWFGSIRVYDASRGVDLWVPVFGATVRIAPDGTYSATVTWFVVSRTAPWIRPVTLTFSVRDGG